MKHKFEEKSTSDDVLMQLSKLLDAGLIKSPFEGKGQSRAEMIHSLQHHAVLVYAILLDCYNSEDTEDQHLAETLLARTLLLVKNLPKIKDMYIP